VRVEIGSWGHIELRYDARGNVYSEKRDFDLSAELGVPFSDTITTRNGSWNSFGQVHNIAHGTGVGTTRQYSRASSLPYSINATSTGESNYETFVLIRNASGLVSRYKHLSHDLTLGWKHGRQVHVPRDQLGRVTSEYSTDTGDDHISQTFTYYGSNEVESVISQVGPAANTRTFNFTYDRRHQLINAFDDKGYASGFEYSHSGRLKSAYVAASGGDGTLVYPRSVDYIYGAADPEIVTELDITGIPPDPEDPTTNDFASFDHDEAGNLIGRELGLQSWSFDYDSSNRMRRREIVGAGDELYYYHDDSRWLAVERDGGGNPTKARFWFGDVEVTYDCDASGCERENTRTYVRHGGRTFARVDEDAQGVRQMKLIHDSGLGHTLGVYDVELTGGVLEYDLELAFQYGPFGETLETLQLGTADPADFLQRFNGKELDPATGLSYYGYRFYDPLSLTWNRSDPLYRFVPDLALTSPRDANLYTFSLNNPVRYLDPDGLDSGGMGCMFSSGACWIDAGRMRNDGMVQTSLAEAAAREEARNRGAETFSQQTILANDGYDPYGTRYPDGGDKGGGSTEILKGLAVGGAVVFCAVKPWACIIGIAFGASTSHGPDKGCGIVVSTGAGCAAGCPRGGAGCSATAGNKIPLPTTKSTSFGPKIADPVPSRGVPKNWSKDQIADVVVDYKASIATRKVELGVFDAAGRGSATQRLAHARRITREEGFLRSLEKALGSRK
jgi:RHS repeat-associated protein